ncbi:hypothetical protein DPMN_080169 [Dreissena polymorpha]|uniref:Uncharacterized protein n=1 Tax=Dreissena polymorpha TaxID=45954 RepID=A0A9D3YQC7_DREPO|nr:hypothetical protein DPMN_080169 [Dreissena polymorpha]
MFKVVAVGSRPEQFSASSLRLLASLLRSSGVYGVLTATWVAVRTQYGRQSGVTGVLYPVEPDKGPNCIFMVLRLVMY